MAQTDDGRSLFGRVRSVHLVLTLLVVMVVMVAGKALISSDRMPAIEPVALIDMEVDQLAMKSAADGLVSVAANAAPMVRSDDLSADGDAVDEGRRRFEAEAQAPGDDALIVRTASLELEVEDVAAILLDARGEIASLGGYVSGSDEFDQGERRWASVTYRVPVDRFSEAIDALRGLSARVVRESTQSQEVTATVVDLDARITNLRASESALVAIMDRSGRIEDVLAVQLRLEDVRGQIERLEAQRNNLSDQAALSTMAVTWFTPVAAVTAAQEGWSLATQVDAALAQTVEALQGVASILVWIAVVGLPVVGIPLLLVLALLVLLRRRVRRDDETKGPGGPAAASAMPAE